MVSPLRTLHLLIIKSAGDSKPKVPSSEAMLQFLPNDNADMKEIDTSGGSMLCHSIDIVVVMVSTPPNSYVNQVITVEYNTLTGKLGNFALCYLQYESRKMLFPTERTNMILHMLLYQVNPDGLIAEIT